MVRHASRMVSRSFFIEMRTDEITAREAFHAAHGASIPDDLCLAISNLPQTFVISRLPSDRQEDGFEGEVLPEIDDDLLLEVCGFAPQASRALDSRTAGQARRRVEAAASKQVQDALVTPVRASLRREDSL